MVDLRELYQDLIIDHQNNPRNYREMLDATHQARGFNPLCGDQVTIYCHINNDEICDISFKGCGCAISQASASLMTEALRGKSINYARELFKQFHTMLTSDLGKVISHNKLATFAGVRAFPMRVKCATLAWHAFESAII